MTQPIDTAYVDIEARTQDFSRKLNRDVEKAYTKVDVQTDLVSKKITKSFDAAGREIKRTFTSIEKKGVVTTHVIEEAFDEAGDKIKRSFKVASAEGVAAEELIAEVAKVAALSTAHSWQHAGERIEDAFREAARVAAIKTLEMEELARRANNRVNQRFTNPFRLALTGLGDLFTTVGRGIGEIATSLSNMGGFTKVLLIVGAIAALAGPIIVLVGALGDLIGLIGPLPAMLGGLVAAILPLVFAFQGLGDAVAAVNEGDPKKIAAAMKNLAPAARAVVKELTGLNSIFTTFRKSIQQAFFAPLVGKFGSTLRYILVNLSKSMSQVSGSLGKLVASLLTFFGKATTLRMINNLFAATAKVIDSMGPGLVTFLNTMLKLTNAGMPFVQRLADAFTGLMTKFEAWIASTTKSGGFNKFIEDAIDTTKKLFGLIGALGNLFGAMFGVFDDEGRDFIQTLTDGTNALADFFRTAEGKEVLQDVVDMIQTTVAVIGGLFELLKFSAGAWKMFKDAVKFAANAVGQFLTAAGKFFSAIGSKIADGFNAVVDFFKKLPGRIMDFIKSLPGMLADFFEMMLNDLLTKIGLGIGVIIFTFTELPKQIVSAVQALPGKIAEIFHTAWDFAKEKTSEGIEAVLGFLRGLPGRIASFAKSVGKAVADFFTRIFSGGKTQASNAFDAIAGFFKNLPSKLGAFVRDVGSDIAGVIKNMINRAINKINEGIAKVDDVLPGSLPRIPHLAKGAIVKARPGGTIAKVAEAGEDEIVGPLKDVARLFEGTGGTTITFGPGAVQVTFEGAVPTAAEAFQTGQAVGEGIVSTLRKRNVRTNVRTL